MKFDDHFSGHAEDYSRYRPNYPGALFRWIADRAPGHDSVWDCATGNGQAAEGLATHFRHVYASDASETQIANASSAPNIDYFVATAYRSGLPADSLDVVTTAQALHWFDFHAFYDEAKRVLRDNGLLTAWCYTYPRDGEAISRILKRYWSEIVGPYWPPERKFVDEKYRTIPFPFRDVKHQTFEAVASWDLPRLLGYLGTWSGAKQYARETGEDPVDTIREQLTDLWEAPGVKRTIRWPVHLVSGRV